MKLGVFVLTVMLSVTGTIASAAPPLVVSRIEAIVRDQANKERQRLLTDADDPEAMLFALRYFKLKQAEREYLQVADRNTSGPYSIGVRGTYSQLWETQKQLEKMEKSLKLPEPDSKDGLYLMRYLYIEEVFPQALAAKIQEIDARLPLTSETVDVVMLERTVRSMRTEIDALTALHHQVTHGRELQQNELAEVVDRIAVIYEDFLIQLAQVPPSTVDRVVGVTMSVGLDALLIGFAILVGENPNSILTWLGLSFFGIAPRLIEAIVWRNPYHLAPFWGTLLRAEELVRLEGRHGALWSQRVIHRDLHAMTRVSEDDWKITFAAHEHACSRVLLEVLDSVVAKAPYGTLPNRNINFPPPVSVGRFSDSL